MRSEGYPPLSFAAHLRKDLIERCLDGQIVRSLIEIGPGRGGMSVQMAEGREYVGYEPDVNSYMTARVRLRDLPNASIVNDVLPARSGDQVLFDALVALEVLEHIEDDQSALREWVQWVRPGGLLLLSVPAHQKRFGRGDGAVGHYRRYERHDLASMMERSGLAEVEIYSYGFPIGYFLEGVRNHLLSPRDLGVCRDLASSRSGRFYQPERWSRLRGAAMAPFNIIQRPFFSTDLGIGYVAKGIVSR